MKENRIQNTFQIATALSMIMLLVLAALAPMAGGWVQQVHRSTRQSALRRGKTDMPAVRIVVPANAVADCFLSNEKELIWAGLRYDVLSLHKEGNQVVFQAVPDVRETRLCAWMAGEKGGATIASGQRFVSLEYLPNTTGLISLCPLPADSRSEFGPEKSMRLPGFKRMVSPPPDGVC